MKRWGPFLVLSLCLPIQAAELPQRQESLDGISIEAVETYRNPRTIEIAVGGGVFPFDPYFTGFSMNVGFTYYFSTTFAWEILSGSYAFSSQNDLTSQLADKYNVTPDTIEKLEYTVSSNLVLIPIYGKAVTFKRFLQNFRSSFILGAGLVQTSASSSVALSIGYRIDTYVSDAFSWRLEIRDQIAFKAKKQFPSFGLGTTLSF